jgi:hypothetical protein
MIDRAAGYGTISQVVWEEGSREVPFLPMILDSLPFSQFPLVGGEARPH